MSFIDWSEIFSVLCWPCVPHKRVYTPKHDDGYIIILDTLQ